MGVIRSENRPLWATYCRARANIATAAIERRSVPSLDASAELVSSHFGTLNLDANESLVFRGIEPSELGCLCNDLEVPPEGLRFAASGVVADMRSNSLYVGEVHGTV